MDRNDTFDAAWSDLGARVPTVDTGVWSELGTELAAAYGDSRRRYHGWTHVVSVLAALDQLTPAPTVAQQLATFVHDVVYDPTAEGYANEEASAVWAEQKLPRAGIAEPVVAECAAFTRATAGHQLDQTPGCAEFLDADLAILGSPADVYDQYAANIRAEYEHVPDELFRQGRAAVLESFAQRDVLYFSERGRELFEAAARANLARELAPLKS